MSSQKLQEFFSEYEAKGYFPNLMLDGESGIIISGAGKNVLMRMVADIWQQVVSFGMLSEIC